jgi:hypothetical protein
MNEEEQAALEKYGHLTNAQQAEALGKLKKACQLQPNDTALKNELDNLIRLTEGYPPFGNRTF